MLKRWICNQPQEGSDPVVDLLFVLILTLGIMAHPNAPQRGQAPKVDGGSTTDVDENTPVLALAADGSLQLNDRPIQRPDLANRVMELLGSEAVIRFRAHPSLPHGDVVQLRETVRGMATVVEEFEIDSR